MIESIALLQAALNSGVIDALASSVRTRLRQGDNFEINGEKITLPKDASEKQIRELIEGIAQSEAGDEATQPEASHPEPTEPSRKSVADPLSRRLVLGDADTVSKLTPRGLFRPSGRSAG
jgi:hypothetical protein